MNATNALNSILADFGLTEESANLMASESNEPVKTFPTPPPFLKELRLRNNGQMNSGESAAPTEGIDLEAPWWIDFVDDNGDYYRDPESAEQEIFHAKFNTVPNTQQPSNVSSTSSMIKPIEEILASRGEKSSWIFEGLIPGSAITLLAGKTKEGKSTLAFHIARFLGEGKDFAGFACNTGSLKTAWVSVEGGWEDELNDKRTLGWDKWMFALSPEHSTRMTVQTGSGEWRKKWDTLTDDLVADGGFGLVVVDHLMGFTTSGGNSVNDDGTSGPLMSALNALAQRTGCAVLLLHHRSDRRGSQNAVLGSTAISSQARALMLLGDRDKAGEQTVRVKANRSPGVVVMEIAQTPTTIKVIKAERVLPTGDSDNSQTNDPQSQSGSVRTGRKPRERGRPRKVKPAVSEPPVIAKKKTKAERQKSIAVALEGYSGAPSIRAKAEFVKTTGVDASLTTIRNDIAEM